MKQPIKMPALSDTMESGRLVRWLKQAGDAVKRGDAIAEVETDKAVMEMDVFESGTLIGPLVAEDQDYPVGETLAWIGDEAGAEAAPAPAKAEVERQGNGAEGKAGSVEQEAGEEPVSAADEQTQLARQAEHAVPPPVETEAAAPESVEPVPKRAPQRAASPVLDQALAGRSAPRGIEGADANAALLKEIESGPPYRIETQPQLRRVVSATVSRAVQTPQFRISTQIDLTSFKEYAEAQAVSFTLLLAKACAMTVKDQPDFNAAWTADGLARRDRVDVAIAMDAEHGLLTPVLRDVAGQAVSQLAEDWRALKEKIQKHRMVPEDFRGATFYVSNLGMFPGIMQFDAVVPPGATAILAVAAPGKQGTVLTLTCDHRVVFGADAARFLGTLGERLADPQSWAA
jgi:pyruvate dehydrogenase E2 component (dihydrolipoamide acetyltransferase)